MKKKINLLYTTGGVQKEKHVAIETLCEWIKTGKYARKVQKIRGFEFVPEVITGEWIQKDYEVMIPVMNISKSKHGYTGIVAVSLDCGSILQVIEAAKAKIRLLPQVLCTFLGLSGKSLKVLIPFTLENGELPKADEDIRLFHATAYQSAAALLMQMTGLKAEGEHGNWTNGMHVSWDEDLYLNPSAIAIPMPQPSSLPKTLVASNTQEQSILPFPDHTQVEMDILRFNHICRRLRFEDRCEVDEYLLKLADECRKAGVDIEIAIRCALSLSMLANKELLVRTSFETAYAEHPMGQKSVWNKNVINQHLLRQYITQRYLFRRNVITGSVEYVERNRYITSWRPLNEFAINSICMAVQDAGIEAWKVDVERYINSDRIADWDPIRDWLSQLPRWDGRDRVSELAECIITPSKEWKQDFAVWMRSMVNQWIGRGGMYGSSMVLLLIGGQGTGKSTFCKRLMPNQLMAYYNDRIDFTSKREAERALMRFGLICMDEFDQITPSQQTYMKHVLQKSDVKWRKMYQDDIEQRKRYATFCGTTNSYLPLNDPSGSRRYLCTEVLRPIDMSYEIDYEQFYSQILQEVSEGKQCYFTAEDERRIQESNSIYQQEVPLKSMLLSMFEKADFGDDTESLTALEILEVLKSRYKGVRCDLGATKTMGRVISECRFPRRRTKRGWVYGVKRV